MTARVVATIDTGSGDYALIWENAQGVWRTVGCVTDQLVAR